MKSTRASLGHLVAGVVGKDAFSLSAGFLRPDASFPAVFWEEKKPPQICDGYLSSRKDHGRYSIQTGAAW